MNWVLNVRNSLTQSALKWLGQSSPKKGRLSYPGAMDFKGQPFFKRLSGKLEFKTSQFETLKKCSSLSYTRVVRKA